MMFHDFHLVGPPVLKEFVLKWDAHGTLQTSTTHGSHYMRRLGWPKSSCTHIVQCVKIHVHIHLIHVL
jgi:hypothetical protein